MISSMISSSGSKQHAAVMPVYVVFVTVAVLVYHLIAEGEFSSVLTLSAIFQCLAFSVLGLQALSSDTVQGISAKSLSLDALALACRLSSTTWLEGYLPADQTGDYLYQIFDALSLAMVLWVMYRVINAKRSSCEEDDDALPALPFAVGSVILAGLLHGDLNDRPIFDALWMCGLFLSAVSVLPQLWMMTHGRRSIPALTSHFVAVMAFSRILSGTYMWHAHSEITCEPWIKDFNHAGYAILAAHAVHLMLLGDFAYFYGKNLATSGLNAPLVLPEAFIV
jgi:ER lumen protein retaining receptor